MMKTIENKVDGLAEVVANNNEAVKDYVQDGFDEIKMCFRTMEKSFNSKLGKNLVDQVVSSYFQFGCV